MLQVWRKTNFERFWFISFLFDNFRNNGFLLFIFSTIKKFIKLFSNRIDPI